MRSSVSFMMAGALAAFFAAAGSASANGSSGPYHAVPGAVTRPGVYAAPHVWYPGGRHWRGHHDHYWRARGPNFVYSTYGWGQYWDYAPRGYEPERPRVILPTPVRPRLGYGRPAAWTAPWYAYCAAKYQSFDSTTGFYTSRSGKKRICR